MEFVEVDVGGNGKSSGNEGVGNIFELDLENVVTIIAIDESRHL